jgi:hypothetical protein
VTRRSNVYRCGALGCALALTSGLAQAADASPAAVATTAPAAPEHASVPHVDVAVVGRFSNAEQMGARVASWFTGQGIAAQTRLAPELSPSSLFEPIETPGVRIWLTQSTPTMARLFFAVQERSQPPRFLVQDVELRSGVDELGIERLAQVAYFSAIAAWEGSAESSREQVEQGLGVKAAAAPAPAVVATKPQPKPSAPPLLAPEKPWWHYVGGFSYETTFHGDSTFIGTGTHGGIARRSGQNELSARLVIQVGFVPYAIKKAGVTFKPSGMLSLGLVLGAKHTLPNGLFLGAELGSSLVLISHRLPFNGRWRPPSSHSQGAIPELTAGLGVGYELGKVKLGLFGTVAVPLVDDRYFAEDNSTGQPRALFSPWAVQPGVSLHFLF